MRVGWWARLGGVDVIARPAPYINAEVDSGGLPTWLSTKDEQNRSGDPAFLAYADDWLSKIDKILAKHQLTNGGGSIVAYQVENEYYDGSADARLYMQHLEDKARTDGITVPLTGNNNGTFNSGVGALDIDGPDSYPQGFNCSNPAVWRGVPDISFDHPAGRPLYTPEFQGGAFDPWGGPGYDKCAQLINDRFANVFYKNNIAVGATAQNFYLTYGGTNWGWLGMPQNYTSYDYGAAPLGTSEAVYPVVPQQPGTAITLDGRDSDIIVADLALGGSRLQYSTSELMTSLTVGGRDIAVLYGAAPASAWSPTPAAGRRRSPPGSTGCSWAAPPPARASSRSPPGRCTRTATTSSRCSP